MTEDYSDWSTKDLVDDLDADEAESIFESEIDPDGPFRYTGELDGWWRGIHMVIEGDSAREREVRAAILEMRS